MLVGSNNNEEFVYIWTSQIIRSFCLPSLLIYLDSFSVLKKQIFQSCQFCTHKPKKVRCLSNWVNVALPHSNIQRYYGSLLIFKSGRGKPVVDSMSTNPLLSGYDDTVPVYPPNLHPNEILSQVCGTGGLFRPEIPTRMPKQIYCLKQSQ